MTIETRFPERFAVLTDEGWLARNRGHDYQNDRPLYDLTKEPRFAMLYKSKGAAAKAATVVGGKVVRVLVQAVL